MAEYITELDSGSEYDDDVECCDKCRYFCRLQEYPIMTEERSPLLKTLLSVRYEPDGVCKLYPEAIPIYSTNWCGQFKWI